MKQDVLSTSITVASALLLTYLSTAAFSTFTQYKIKERANGCSEINGECNRLLEAPHLNHDRNSGFYDSDSNGVMCTDIQHLAYHVMYRGKSKQIGLKESFNERAIKAIKNRVIKFNKSNYLEYSEKYINKEISKSILLWKNYLENLPQHRYIES